MATIPTDLPAVNNPTTAQVTVTQVRPNFDQIETNLETLRAALANVNTEVGGLGFQPKIDELILAGGLNAINPVGTLFSGGNFDATVVLRDVPAGAQLRISGRSIIPNRQLEVLQAAVTAVEGINNTTIPFTSMIDNSTEGNTYDLFFEVLMSGTPITTETFRMLFSNTPNLGTVTYWGVADTIVPGSVNLATLDSVYKVNGIFGIPSLPTPAYLWMFYPASADHPQIIEIGSDLGGPNQAKYFFMQTGVRTIGGVSYSAARTQRRLTNAGDLGGRQFIVSRRTF